MIQTVEDDTTPRPSSLPCAAAALQGVRFPTGEELAAHVAERMTGFRDAMELSIRSLGDAFAAVAAAINRIFDPLGYRPGAPVTPDHRIIRATGRRGRGWLAWRLDCWAPVHRVRGVGWVWGA